MTGKIACGLTLLALLAGCVAPEEPKPVRQAAPAVVPSTPPRANLEDAPIPNRRLRAPTDNTVRVEQ
jgi:hypothetical protein